MPISREVFQVRTADDENNIVGEVADTLGTDKVSNIVRSPESSGIDVIESATDFKDGSSLSATGNAKAVEGPQEGQAKSPLNLPSADTTSAETKEAVGAAHPQRETHRSAATGRDVPRFTNSSQEREETEFNWDEARAQSEAFERRARLQRDAATEHLARIHDIVGLLIEMSEAHSHNGDRKLQSLESKVVELEARLAVNRS